MTGIQVYFPDDEDYDAIDRVVTQQGAARSTATKHYNEIAEAYNSSDVGSYLSLGDKDLRLSNVEKVFFNRGLVRDTDYSLSRPSVDITGKKKLRRDERPARLQRLTDAVMRIV